MPGTRSWKIYDIDDNKHNKHYPNSITFENIPKGLIFFKNENIFIVHVVVAKKKY